MPLHCSPASKIKAHRAGKDACALNDVVPEVERIRTQLKGRGRLPGHLLV